MDPKEKESILRRSRSENDYGRKDEMAEQVAAKGRQYGRSGLATVGMILLLIRMCLLEDYHAFDIMALVFSYDMVCNLYEYHRLGEPKKLRDGLLCLLIVVLDLATYVWWCMR